MESKSGVCQVLGLRSQRCHKTSSVETSCPPKLCLVSRGLSTIEVQKLPTTPHNATVRPNRNRAELNLSAGYSRTRSAGGHEVGAVVTLWDVRGTTVRGPTVPQLRSGTKDRHFSLTDIVPAGDSKRCRCMVEQSYKIFDASVTFYIQPIGN